MAGTIPGFSLAQQQDSDGTPLVGGKLYTIQAGTTATPQNAYQDSGLTIPLPNPIICDAFGRLPQFFLADGNIKLRLTKSNGNQVFAADGILVVGASSGGGGGSPVDPTTVLQTGWMQAIYGTGVVSGFVRCNNRTIGSATSGATERANADTLALYTFLYNQDVNLAVSGGRGANAAADYAANKTIALPDWRGRALAFLDDMGNTPAGILTNAGDGFGSANGETPTTLGAKGGVQKQAISLAQLPAGITVAGTGTITSDISNLISSNVNVAAFSATPGASVFQAFTSGSTTTRNVSVTSSGTMTSNNTIGNNTPSLPPMRLATIYLKL